MSYDPAANGSAESVAETALPVVAASDGGHPSVAPSAPGVTFNRDISTEHRTRGPGFLVRAIWYVFVGWWLTGIAITFAWLCALTVVLLPIAYVIVNKIPVILTLRPRSIETIATVDADGTVRISTAGASQRAFWQRALWFACVGWWACALAMYLAYFLCLTIVLFPVGLMLFNRVPAVLTLQRN